MRRNESWGAIAVPEEAHSAQWGQPPRMHGQKEQRATPVPLSGCNYDLWCPGWDSKDLEGIMMTIMILLTMISRISAMITSIMMMMMIMTTTTMMTFMIYFRRRHLAVDDDKDDCGDCGDEADILKETVFCSYSVSLWKCCHLLPLRRYLGRKPHSSAAKSPQQMAMGLQFRNRRHMFHHRILRALVPRQQARGRFSTLSKPEGRKSRTTLIL